MLNLQSVREEGKSAGASDGEQRTSHTERLRPGCMGEDQQKEASLASESMKEATLELPYVWPLPSQYIMHACIYAYIQAGMQAFFSAFEPCMGFSVPKAEGP